MSKISKTMKKHTKKQNLNIWNLKKSLMIMNIEDFNMNYIKSKRKNMKIKLLIFKEK